MGRKKKEESTQLATRMDKAKKEALGQRIIDMGYWYLKDSKRLPAWRQWLEAVSDRELEMYKRVP
jgi:hypothetical protein